MTVANPPRDGLVRALPTGLEVRDDTETSGPVLAGHFAVFNEWTEIDSVWEGNFLERIAPGAFTKTFKENRAQMRVTLNHGRDPELGDKVLGTIRELSQDDTGAAYEVPLFDGIPDLVMNGLRAGAYGSSFRFRVMKEEFEKQPKESKHNPRGLPERTLKEIHVSEFGPVTFPAYASATAGIRSLTDEFMFGRLVDDPDRLRELVEAAVEKRDGVSVAFARGLADATGEAAESAEELAQEIERKDDALPANGAEAEPHSTEGSRETPAVPPDTQPQGKETAMASIEEVISRQAEIKARQEELYKEHGTDLLPDALRAEWDQLEEEYDLGEQRIKQDREMRHSLERKADKPGAQERIGQDDRPKRTRVGSRDRLPQDVFDITAYRAFASSPDEQRDLIREGAKVVVEGAVFPHSRSDHADTSEHIDKLLQSDATGELAERILVTGSPAYQRAFGKMLVERPLTSEEQRALSLTTTAGGYAVPFVLDPTVILTSDGQVNPIRSIARVETVTGNEWRGIASAGVTAAYGAELTEAGDNAPTFTQPVANVEKAQAFIPFSIEIGEDWGSLQSEMARLLADAKDGLEASRFVHGLGHTTYSQPEGILVGGTAVVSTAAATALAVGDLYALENALPDRFMGNAKIVGNRTTYNRIRALDTTGGSSLWARIGEGRPGELLGIPALYSSAYVGTLTSASSILTIGDWSHFLIVDRVGMSVELIPHMFATANNRPSGQRGLYAYWRNTADVLAWQAFRTLKIT